MFVQARWNDHAGIVVFIRCASGEQARVLGGNTGDCRFWRPSRHEESQNSCLVGPINLEHVRLDILHGFLQHCQRFFHMMTLIADSDYSRLLSKLFNPQMKLLSLRARYWRTLSQRGKEDPRPLRRTSWRMTSGSDSMDSQK